MADKIVVGSDHAGLAMKYELVKAAVQWGWEVEDLGAFPLGKEPGLRFDDGSGTLATTGSADYPEFALQVARRVATGDPPLGLLICGSGIGMSIAANKVAGVRAALCQEPYSAAMARAHNNANVLCIGGRVVGPEVGKAMLRAFLDGEFEGGRHQRRLDMITAAEKAVRK